MYRPLHFHGRNYQNFPEQMNEVDQKARVNCGEDVEDLLDEMIWPQKPFLKVLMGFVFTDTEIHVYGRIYWCKSCCFLWFFLVYLHSKLKVSVFTSLLEVVESIIYPMVKKNFFELFPWGMYILTIKALNAFLIDHFVYSSRSITLLHPSPRSCF